MEMNINDKIKQILIEKNLSPSHFADEIGVQRSSISHILSGRNRPSFDIIQKIIRRFPDLGFDWILEEEPVSTTPTFRNPNRFTEQQRAMTIPNQNSGSYSNTGYNSSGIRSQRAEIPPMQSAYPAEELLPETEKTLSKTVERILIFYSDGTFKEYSPM